MMLNHLDLCSGIGGFALGFEWANLSKPIAFCDTDEWCQKVLAKNFPNIPVYNDVKEIANDTKRFIQQPIDILTSGYPCQPFSVASHKRKGTKDERHIFPYIFRIVEQTRPTYCIYENVYGHVSLGLDEVLFQMESINYHTRTFILPSSSIGAWHKRDRVWIVCKDLTVCDSEHNGSSSPKKCRGNEEVAARTQKRSEETKQFEGTSRSTDNEFISDPNNKGLRSCIGGTDNDLPKKSGERRNDGTTSTSHDERSNSSPTTNESMELSNSNCEGLERRIIQPNMEEEQRQVVAKRSLEEQRTWWEIESELHGVPDGISYELDKDRTHRLRGLGNAICPQNSMYLGLALKKEIENGKTT
jgi:DNA (cytosine-5)-methyltransferase 1